MKASADESGAKLVGLDYRMKGEGSAERKIAEDSRVRQQTARQTAYEVADMVRYTAQFAEDQYVAGVKAMLSDLEKRGMRVGRFRNTWLPDAPYRGVNVQMIAPKPVRGADRPLPDRRRLRGRHRRRADLGPTGRLRRAGVHSLSGMGLVGHPRLVSGRHRADGRCRLRVRLRRRHRAGARGLARGEEVAVAPTATTKGSGKYQVIVGTPREECAYRSNDQNELSRIRASAFVDGLGVSLIHEVPDEQLATRSEP